MGHVVKAGYVTVETAVPGGRAQVDIPRSARLPDDVPEAEVRALLERGDIEPDAPAPRPAPQPVKAPEPDPDAVPDGTIPAVIDWVDGDKVRAQRALDAEQAKGETARTTLVNQLQQLLAAGE